MKKCLCGCGKSIKDDKLYFWGHNGKGISKGPLPQEVKDKLSKSLKGRIIPTETRIKMSKAHMGRIVSQSTREKIGKSNSIALKGNTPWNKGKKCPWVTKNKKGKKLSEETKEKLRASHMGYIMPEKQKEKIRQSNIKSLTPEGIRRRLSRRDKSSLELKFEKIVNDLGLPYIFVGNGGVVVVSRKIPDFIKKGEDKVAVEVYYRKHKERFGKAKFGGIENWKSERTKIFNNAGWKIVFFDETQVTPENVMNTLGGIQ